MSTKSDKTESSIASATESTTVSAIDNPTPEAGNTTVQGRSVFMVETTAGGIAVQTSFLTEQGQMLQMPAIFPNQDYALAQIDELRRLVSMHFAQAAQVGAQVIAAQQAAQAQNAPASSAATQESTAS